MKKKIWFEVIIIMILAAVIGGFSFRDMKLYYSDEWIDLNTASIDELSKSAKVRGEVNYVDGCFAIYEEEEKTLGITTSKKETNYYLVASFSKEELQEWHDSDGESGLEDYYFVVFSAASDEMKNALDKNFDEWDEYYEGTRLTPPDPVPFEGRLLKQPTSDEYIGYRDEFLRDSGIYASEVAVYKISDSKVTGIVVGIFVGCCVVCLVCLVILIAMLLSLRRKKDETEYY